MSKGHNTYISAYDAKNLSDKNFIYNDILEDVLNNIELKAKNGKYSFIVLFSSEEEYKMIGRRLEELGYIFKFTVIDNNNKFSCTITW